MPQRVEVSVACRIVRGLTTYVPSRVSHWQRCPCLLGWRHETNGGSREKATASTRHCLYCSRHATPRRNILADNKKLVLLLSPTNRAEATFLVSRRRFSKAFPIDCSCDEKVSSGRRRSSHLKFAPCLLCDEPCSSLLELKSGSLCVSDTRNQERIPVTRTFRCIARTHTCARTEKTPLRPCACGRLHRLACHRFL